MSDPSSSRPPRLLDAFDRFLPARLLSPHSEERMRQRLLLVFGAFFAVAVLPWVLWLFVLDPAFRLPRVAIVAVSVALAANAVWLRFAPPRRVAWLTVVLLHFAVFVNIYLNQGMHGPSVLSLTCLPVICAVLLGIAWGWIDGGLVVLFALLLEHLARTRGLPATAPTEVWAFIRVMALSIAIVLMMAAVSSYIQLTRRQAEELVEARDAALAASRSKTRFLSTMSHELRTPMVGVVGAADLLSRTPMSAEQLELVSLLQRSAAAQLALIGNVLDLARIEADRLQIEKTPWAPRQLLGEVEALFRVACQSKGLELRMEIDAGIPSALLGDSLRLRQILSNLLGNAVKFTEQGAIAVRAGWNAASQPPLLRFAVSDTGIGFPPERTAELFEAFRQADDSTTRRFGGSGLGLTICRRLVEAMGGSIGAESRPGEGSTFFFEVPAEATVALQPITGQAIPVGSPAGRRALTILLADDDPVNRVVLAAMLQALGHRTIEAVDGRDALLACASRPIDLVILDLHMPELDGPECARAMRALPPPVGQLPIVGLTADAVVDNHDRYLAGGLDAIYSKPIDLEGLELAIAAVVGGRSQ